MTSPKHQVDLIIEARWVIPIEPSKVVLENHSVIVDKGLICQILPTEQARESGWSAKQTFSLDNHILIPGLVNAHTHAAMSLFRGLADDLPLKRWLHEAIWPIEGRHVSADFVKDGTLLAAAEMLRGGITCVNDMYFFPDAAAQSFVSAGMRAVIGITVLDSPNSYASDADDYLRKGLHTRDQWKNHPLIQFSLAPHSPYTVDDTTFEHVATLSTELDCPIHTHLYETREEVEESLAKYGMRPLARMAKLGLLGPNLSLAHGVHLNEHELDLLAHHDVSVVHNPSSNMKLASGAAPVHGMLARGLNVGLGTDGAASNNRLDIFQEMRHAALLAKLREFNASALSAHEVLRMATLGGAKALGLGNLIGSIEAGKAADLCAISLAAPHAQPCFDPASHLVYVVGREDVSHVWIAGEERVRNGELLHMHNNSLLRLTRMWQNVIQG